MGIVGHDAVKGRDGDGLVEHILIGAQSCDLGPQVSARRVGLRLGLVELRHGLSHRGHVDVVGGLLGVVVLLGQNAVLIESLGALPIQLLLLQIGLGVLHVGLGGLFRGNIGSNVGLGGGDGRFLAGDIGLLLHILDGGHRLALLHHVTLFHIEVGDAAHRGGADIHIGLRLDLAGAADHRGQILAHDLGGQNLGVAGLLPPDEDGNQHDNNHDGKNNQKYLLHVGCVLPSLSDFSLRNCCPRGSQKAANRFSELAESAFRRWKRG